MKIINKIKIQTDSTISQDGFTRLDLLAVVFCFILASSLSLAAMRPASSGGSKALQCIQNTSQLLHAWLNYTYDNEGHFPGAESNDPNSVNWIGETTESRLSTWLNLPISDESEINPSMSIAKSPLTPYLSTDYSVWRCPSDPSTGSMPNYMNGRPQPRVRSYSMNSWLHGTRWTTVGGWKMWMKTSDIIEMAPSDLLVILDERADSINDEQLFIDMSGFGLSSDSRSPAAQRMIDYPASYHSQSATVSFADGSVLLKSWTDDRTMPSYTGNELILNIPSPSNPDVHWLQWHATRQENP